MSTFIQCIISGNHHNTLKALIPCEQKPELLSHAHRWAITYSPTVANKQPIPKWNFAQMG